MVAMAKVSGRSSKARFAAYVEKLTGVIGHADRAGPLRDYCTGLLMPAERKSVEPMAAVTARDRPAGDDARGADCRLDHRRHELPQEGAALGRGGTPVLRPARQAGQLPSGGQL